MRRIYMYMYVNLDPHGLLVWIWKHTYDNLFVCFIAAWAIFFSYPAAVTITGDRTANLDLCLALAAFKSEGTYSCHTYCNTGPRFRWYHPNGRRQGFEPGTHWSQDLRASALTTAPRGRLTYNICIIYVYNTYRYHDIIIKLLKVYMISCPILWRSYFAVVRLCLLKSTNNQMRRDARKT
jgi:hypothetical protein